MSESIAYVDVHHELYKLYDEWSAKHSEPIGFQHWVELRAFAFRDTRREVDAYAYSVAGEIRHYFGPRAI